VPDVDAGSRSPGRRSIDREGRPAGQIVPPGAPARKRRATRDGRESLVVSMPPQTIKLLKIAALERDTTASAIVTRAVDGWLRDHRRTGR
jgi:hypothetical protein